MLAVTVESQVRHAFREESMQEVAHLSHMCLVDSGMLLSELGGRPRPTIAGTFSVPGRSPRSWSAPTITGAMGVPPRT